MTKKEQNMVDNYNYSVNRYGIRDLADVYKSCSVFKLRAWAQIKAECEQNNGSCLTVVSYNCNFFTAAYFVDIDDAKSILHYHTPYHHYEILCVAHSKIK